MIFLSPSVQGGAEDESAWTDFDIISKLGQGAFGKVYKVAHKRNRLTYAIKELSKSQLRMSNMVEQIANEVKIMYSLDHPYIVKLLNHFEDDHNICLIVELASGVIIIIIIIKNNILSRLIKNYKSTYNLQNNSS